MNGPFFHAIGIERLRVINDGEGITTLVAGHGCPLRCQYCLNPQCFEQPRPAKSYSVEELINEVSVDDLYFQATGGGVVFGGGEPLLQSDFIHAFRESAPKEWKIYLESSLAVEERNLLTVIDDIDFFLIDIKDMNDEIYERYTGRKPHLMLQNLQLLADRNLADKVMIRLPLIAGYNTEEDRTESETSLRKMGFSSFDRFSYSVKKALEKRRQIGA